VFSAPILAAGGVGLKAAADFDTLMKQIEVFGNLAPEQLKTVGDFALQMGADTKFSSSDAAASLLDLLKSGQSLEQAMASLPEVLNLAAAGELGLAEAAGIVSSGLATFRLGANEAGRVSDALARAANASRADVRGLGLAMTNVGPVAKQFGLSIEDTAAVLGVFANNGIMGGEAGTALKSVLLNLNRPTADVKDALAELGLNLYDANGNARDFNTIIQEMDTALDRLPVEQQNRLMQTLGGSFGIVGLSALRASSGIGDMKNAMAAAPAAGEVASSFMQTFAGRVESLRGSVETLMITALTPLMNDVLTPLVERITTVVNSITEWTQANPQLTSQIVRVLAVVAGIGPALLVAGKAISIIGTIIGAVMSPVGLLVAGLSLLKLAFDNNFLGIRDTLAPVIERITTAFGYLFEVFSGDKAGGLKNLFVTFEDGSSVIGEFLETLLGLDQQTANELGQGINTFIQNVVSGAQQIAATVIPILQSLANWFITEALPAIVNFVTTVVIPAVQGFINILSGVWSVVGPVLGILANWFITDVLPRIVAFINDTVVPNVQTFIGILEDIWNRISPALEDLYNWFITDGLPAIQDGLSWFSTNVLQPAIDTLSGIWNTVSSALGNLYNWFVTTGLPFIQEALQGFKTNFWDPFVTTLRNIWTAIQPAVEAFKNGIASAFNWVRDNIVNPLKQRIEELEQTIRRVLGGLGVYQGVAANAQTVGNMLANGQATPGQVIGAFGRAIGQEFFGVRDAGGPGLAGMPYLIGKPQMGNEVFVPSTNGTFIPDFAKLAAAIADNQGGNIYVQMPEAALASPGAAEMQGHIFGQALLDEWRRRGN